MNSDYYTTMGPGSTMLGNIMQGLVSYRQARTEEMINDYNYAVNVTQAKAERQAGAYDAELQRLELRKLLAENEAATAASGVMMVDSPIDAQLDLIETYARDIAVTGVRAERRARGFEMKGYFSKLAAKSAAKAGKLGLFQSIVGGIGDLAAWQSKKELAQE